jgi:hypothetical protein
MPVKPGTPGGTPVLFPRLTTNIDGTRAVSGGTYREALYRWLENCDVRDEHGKPVHLTPHQWRHTLGTVLINRDVPQHVVQKILDHDSPLMTAHYARLSDKTVREHWEKARKVNAGMSVRDIIHHLRQVYGTELSPETVSRITDQVLDEVKAWQSRPLDPA